MSLKNKIKPVEFSPDKKICDMFMAQSTDGKLSCANAFMLAEKLGLNKSEAGYYADYLTLRLAKCQIGLFGHGEKGKLIRKLESPDEKILEQVTCLKEGDRLSCENVFKIARDFKVSLTNVGSVCQTMGVKIKDCRLGAF